MDDPTDDLTFGSSVLSSKEHWDNEYMREMENYKSFGDIGEIWFGESCQRRVINWFVNHVSFHSRILDIGCGNGSLLLQLSKLGFSGLNGMDYSLPAVELAKRLVEQDKANVNIFLGDILDGNTFKDFTGCVDVCVDKGTFDAISLSMDKVNEKKDKYRQSIISLLKDDGLFMIVSCNWTETELIDFFSEVRLVPMDTIPAPLIKFGGVTGQTTSTVIFKKKLL